MKARFGNILPRGVDVLRAIDQKNRATFGLPSYRRVKRLAVDRRSEKVRKMAIVSLPKLHFADDV
jgi:hypothetical protein